MKIKVSKILENKMLIFRFLVILLIILSVFLFFMNRRVSNLEKVKIDEFNKEALDYLDEVIETKDEGKYLSFAIKYLSDKKGKNSFTDDEVLDTINTLFNVKYDLKSLEEIGISVDMANAGITHESNNYSYNNSKTKQDIASTKVIKYKVEDISKKGRSKFVVTIKRLIVDNPYEVLNYYTTSDIENNESNDYKDLKAYLDGTGSIRGIKKYINEDNSKEDGKITITYIIDNDKLLIDKID